MVRDTQRLAGPQPADVTWGGGGIKPVARLSDGSHLTREAARCEGGGGGGGFCPKLQNARWDGGGGGGGSTG